MTDLSEREKLIARIRALLAKTEEAGCSEGEAMAAAAKAAELMDRYDLHEAAMLEDAAESFEWQAIPMVAQWHAAVYEEMANAIGRFTGTVAAVKDIRGKRKRTIEFWGKRGDVEFARWLCSSLGSFVLRGLQSDEVRHWVGKGRQPSVRERTRYRRGYMLMAAGRIAQRLDAITAERVKAAPTGNLPAIISKEAAARAALSEAGTVLDPPNKSRSIEIDASAVARGIARGNAATFNRPIQNGTGASAGLPS